MTKMVTRPGTLDEFIFREVRGYKKYITLEPSDRWLDAGANIGAFSALISPDVALVAAYEPDMENFTLCKQNLAIGGASNVHAVRAALVGNQDTERTFYLNVKKNKGAHSLLAKRGRESVTVPCQNINDALQQYQINKIKMDVEGAEQELLYAIEDWSAIEEIVLEFHLSMLGDKDRSLYNAAVAHLRRQFPHVAAPTVKNHWHVTVHAKR